MPNRDADRQAILAAIERQKDLAGRFEQISRVSPNGGNGHFSLIVMAYDRATKARVALKFFDPNHRSDSYRWECFDRESRMLGELVGEPDIVQRIAPIDQFSLTFDHYGIKLSVPFAYYALELAIGDVGHIIATDGWSVVEKIRHFRTMCRAVQRIHGRDMAHRDLKPSNFLALSRNLTERLQA